MSKCDCDEFAKERAELLAEIRRLTAVLREIGENYHWKDSPAGVAARAATKLHESVSANTAREALIE